MRSFFLLMIFFLVGVTSNGYAQEENTSSPLTAPLSQQKVVPKGTEGQSLENILANEYYKKCNEQYIGTDKEVQNMFCACQAAKMVESMSAEEITSMEEDTKAGRYQKERKTFLVTMPCVEDTTGALIKEQCTQNMPQNSDPTMTLRVCGCLEFETKKFVNLRGRTLIAMAGEKTGQPFSEIGDPIIAVMTNPLFLENIRTKSAGCVRTFKRHMKNSIKTPYARPPVVNNTKKKKSAPAPLIQE